MTRRMVLHIGLSKTGTTSIQTFLSQNRDRLAAHDILYPDVSGVGPLDPRLAPSVLRPGTAPVPHHIALALELRKPKGDRSEPSSGTPLWSEVFRQIEEKRPDTTIISYENFYMNPKSYSFNLLTDRLKVFDIHGILYLRPLEDWMVSLYSQAVKGVERKDVKFSRYVLMNDASSRFSYMIDSVLEYLPINSLSVVDFSVAAGGGLIRDFLDRSGVAGNAIAGDGPARATNVALPSWATLFLLRCNRTRLSDGVFLEIRNALAGIARPRTAPSLRPGLDIATPEERQGLRDIAAADADRLWERHGVKLAQKVCEPIAYRAFDDEDFKLIGQAIGSRLSPAAHSELGLA